MNGASTSETSGPGNDIEPDIIEIPPIGICPTAPTTGPTSLGFCHSCNKHVQISLEAYSCSVCKGGFIELFNLDTPPVAANESVIVPAVEVVRPIDRLIHPQAQLRTTTSDNTSNIDATGGTESPSFFLINPSDISNSSQTERGDEFSPLTTPIFQLIRRLNNRRMRASNVMSPEPNSDPPTTTTPTTSPTPINPLTRPLSTTRSPEEVLIETDSDSNTEWPPAPATEQRNTTTSTNLSTTIGNNQNNNNNPSSGTTLNNSWNSRARTSSFHYRLRRHVHNTNTGSSNGNHPTSGNNNGNPEATTRRIPIHRHRFHRSPSHPRFHFNFNEDDEFLNDHGAIIITTLINQLRNTNRGAAPASEIDIQSLPKIEVDQALVDRISQCAVCMEDFLLNDSAKQLPCNHLYHDPCIDQWLKLHATCPICRKNISGAEAVDQQAQLDNSRSTLLNIFPLNSGVAAGRGESGGMQTRDPSGTYPTLHQNHSNTSSYRGRVQPIRNRQLYRIQIRQALNNSTASDSASSHAALLEQREHLLRQRRIIGDSIADSLAFEERENGVRATAVLINPQWNSNTSSTNTNANTGTGNLGRDRNLLNPNGNEPGNSMSAFSLMNEYRNFQQQRSTSNADAESVSVNSNDLEAVLNDSQEVNDDNGSNATAGNSIISNMMGRLLSRYRNNRLARSYLNSNGSSQNTTPDRTNPARINASITINNRPVRQSLSTLPIPANSGGGNIPSLAPSISLRLGQLFRSSMNLPPHTEQLDPTNTPENEPQTEATNPAEEFTENPNNYFDFSLFNRAQMTENNLLLDRLFDIPEDVQTIHSDDNDDDTLDDSDDDSDTINMDEHVPSMIRSDEFNAGGRPHTSESNELAGDMPQAKKQKTESIK